MTSDIHLSVTLTPELRLKHALKQAGIKDPASVTKLTVAGRITENDFEYIRKNMRETLQELDMGNASVEENKIPDFAFNMCRALTSVILPDTVTEIGESIFNCGTRLTSLIIPRSVVKIGAYPVDDCRYLHTITVHPDNPVYKSVNGKIRRKRQAKTKMLNFAAIDFETANHHPSSVCSVGVVIVRDGQIVDKIYSLIRPEPEWYSFTQVHGLTAADTQDAKVFPHVWKEIAPKIEGLPLVAHNSRFDEGCLRAAFSVYQMDYPDYRFHCTCSASRKKFGKTLPNHQLHTVAAHCGYDLQNHHHALADAEACAVIALKIL